MVKSYFAGGSDKKCSKSIYMGHWNRRKCSAKDDIDVYAHLRGEGPKASTVLKDPRPFTTLYALCSCFFSRDQWEQTSRF
jgi:hypothetical protein